jgi:hypothetical protein
MTVRAAGAEVEAAEADEERRGVREVDFSLKRAM